MSAETSLSMTAQGGIVLIDKPSGMTSHDVVARMRRRLGTKRVGHAGTLDPMATGLLVVLFGEGTKLEPYLSISDKAYEAVIAFGRSTDTLDAEGQTIAEEAPSAELVRELCDLEADLERAAPLFQAALEQERARREQIPPAFSAIKVDGVRSHRLARKGELLDLPARNVRILELALRRASSAKPETLPSVALYLLVTKGYYVRSFARDLGEALGCSSHLAGLRRVAAGSFEIARAAALDCSEAELDAHKIAIVDVETRGTARRSASKQGVWPPKRARSRSRTKPAASW